MLPHGSVVTMANSCFVGWRERREQIGGGGVSGRGCQGEEERTKGKSLLVE